MNKELMEKLTKHADKVLNFVEKAGETSVDFAQEQAPIVISEILAWGLVYNGFFCCLYLIMFLVSLTIFIKTRKNIWYWQEKNPGEPIVLLYLLTFPPIIPSFCLFIQYLIITAKVLTAPRLYLIEQLQTIIHTK